MDPAHIIDTLQGYLTQRGCMVFCMRFWVWFWLSLLAGFVLGWIGHSRVREHYESTSEKPPEGE
jgi:hypothetical protein